MKIVLALARIIVGILFIFSGLVKANDPLGLSYKMQEFFEVWNLHSLNDYTLAFSILMIAFEIIAGVAVLAGWKMRLFSWLLMLLIVFFTFLTAYALFSGKIRACGCFGDCIPLTAAQSFMKDIILLLLILLIFIKRKTIHPIFRSAICVVILAVTTVFSFAIQWYVLTYLPIVDCLPYKTGKNISLQRVVPPGAIPDSTVINFVYEKQGKQLEFTAENFPADFDDSLYHFVRRYDKLVRKGNAEPPIKDFSLTTPHGTDTTTAILENEGLIALLFIKDDFPEDPQWLSDFEKCKTALNSAGATTFIVTNASDETLANSKSQRPQNLMVLKCDAVAIKTAARFNPTLYILKKGTILGKWAAADFAEAINFINLKK